MMYIIVLCTLIQKKRIDEVVGMAIAIEKSFQPGRERLENAGYRVESLVRIKEFKDNGCVFIED